MSVPKLAEKKSNRYREHLDGKQMNIRDDLKPNLLFNEKK